MLKLIYVFPLILLALFCLPAVALADTSAQDQEIRIKLIEIKGNIKIDRRTILSRMILAEGDLFSPEQIQADIKTLYQMGFFEHVSVESKGLEGGIALYFIVHERPFLIEVLYEGNENIDKDQLDEALALKTQSFLDPEAIGRSVEQIKLSYESEAYYNAKVVPITQILPDNRAILSFLIEEGEQAYVKNISFTGNTVFDEDALSSAMETSSYFWLTSWVTESGRYKKEQLAFDQERIKDLYMNDGYFEVAIDEPKVILSEDREWFDITLPIIEGEVFSIASVSFAGAELFDDSKLFGLIQTKSGTTFNRGQLRKDIAQIVESYGEKGYIYANAVPDLQPGAEKDSLKLTYHIVEGDQVKVREINISGNDKTRDKVIRREMRVKEQETVNTKALRRSFQRINNLNFFEDVNIVPAPIEPGWIDLDVEVKEKPTGTFSIGGGFSSQDKFVATADITMGNFLGKGQLVKLRAETGRRRNTYSLTFREPYLFDQNLSGTVSLFNTNRNFGSYRENRLGGDLIVGRAFGEYVRGSTSYTLETLEVTDLDLITDVNGDIVVSPVVPFLVRQQESLGRTVTSSVGFSISRDTRDFAFDPKDGGRDALSFEYAGTFLGGDNAYHKTILNMSRFHPLWLDHVISARGIIGFAEGIDGKVLPVGERFFVGGINTVRGFQFGEAGPIDPLGEILGGNKQAFLNIEYLIPIVAEANIKLLLFYDWGAGFNDNQKFNLDLLRKAAGFGIRWISPVGPLRLEWGYNLEPRLGEADRQVEFSIGSPF